jgi:SET domain-containing protein
MKPVKQARPTETPAVNGHGSRNGRRIQVRRSGVHGKGVFALQPIEPGETLIEYTGEVISWAEALDRHPHDPSQPDHTFYFQLDNGAQVIDALYGGNAARWINHACEPNCEADETDGRVFIKALRPIAPGEELFYDYRLSIDERLTPSLKKRFECRCGAADCRGTLLLTKRAAAAPPRHNGRASGRNGRRHEG